MFELAILVVAIVAGATASVVGFGIGSLLTPLLTVRYGPAVAVAAVTVPHALATCVRWWRLRANVDRGVLLRFGILSALGALAGALIYTRLGPTALTRVLGLLLLLTAVAQLTGWTSRWRPRGVAVSVFGLLSGLFGGVAGNQGGLRSAALLAFDLPPLRFVATATAIGLLVDAARTPIYVWHAGPALIDLWMPILIASVGVLMGTAIGERILLGLPRDSFARIVGFLIGLLGCGLLVWG